MSLLPHLQLWAQWGLRLSREGVKEESLCNRKRIGLLMWILRVEML